MEIKIAVTALSALAHEGRLEVFRMLVQAGGDGLPAGEIAKRLGVPPNTLSANLNVLSHAALIGSRREGRSIIYTASYDRMAGLLGFLMEDCCQGASEICVPLAEVVNRAACCAAENKAVQS
ncbi:helix-turn-helix transcriptional regulator [Roseomonas sp. KE0001]|uniref:ArsR/SmtB family transcription factor n=1 Tax=Roseomonas sp. KE0001 TaxID=2479201 RepID=UPI0018DF792E|nr:metalloregulator ArsR/SmtB family transcription factor [Roseomonas sp. KE0001]MBI0433504.1 ArsR family transcriptional regulator [Roseomonas sp. KE0001]